MKSATLVTTLTGLTTAMAVAAPLVVFGFLFVLQVHPEQKAAAESRYRLAEGREELNRWQLLVRPQPVVTDVSALAEFEARIAEGSGVSDAADALTAVLNSQAVGGVLHVAVETGAPEDAASDSTAGLFSQTVKQTPVTLTFDARYEQIGRFFSNLRLLPMTVDVQSVDVTQRGAPGTGLVRAKVSLLVFHEPRAAAPEQASRPPSVEAQRADTPRPAAPKDPDPVVTSILFSSGRRIAIADGRIVRAGDRVRAGIIREIEADALVIAGPDGRERRVAITRSVVPSAKR